MNEKIKRITGRYMLPSLLIMLSLCILFVPAAGSDEADSTTDSDVTSYGIWIGGTEITSENTMVSNGRGGAAIFDEETKTLTLQDYNFEADGIGIESTENLTLNISGINNIKSTSYGINAPGLTIKGNGTLNIVSETIGIKSYGSRDANIKGESEGSRLTVDIQAGQGGIHVNGGSLYLNYCDITIKGKGSSPSGNGIYVFTPGTLEQCTINQCTVVLKNNYGMDLYGKLSVKKSLIEIESLGHGIIGSYVSPEIEDSIVTIEADLDGIYPEGSASNPNFGDVTLDNSDLVIKYGRYAATTYLMLIIEGNSSVVMECDDAHATSSSKLIGNSKDLTVKIKMNDYVLEHNEVQYTKEELTSTSKFGYRSIDDYDYYGDIDEGCQSFGIHPKLTVSFDGSGMEGSMDQISEVKGEVVELPSESQFTYTGVGTFVGWEDDGKQFYPAGHVIILTSDMVLTPVYEDEELSITHIAVEVIGEFFINDSWDDSDFLIKITYSNGKTVRIHTYDTDLAIEGFDTGSYKQNATAMVKYGGETGHFTYSVGKLTQSLYVRVYSISPQSPDRVVDLNDYYNDLKNGHYFGTVEDENGEEAELTIKVISKTAEFEYDETTKIISNITKPGSFTLELTRAGNDIYNEATATVQWNIYQFDLNEKFVITDCTPVPGDDVTIDLYGSPDGQISIDVKEGYEEIASVNENVVSISKRGEDGIVILKIAVSGSSVYEDGEIEYTVQIGKAPGHSEAGYTQLQETYEISGDQNLSDIALPRGWSWVDSDISLQRGENTVQAKYSPTDTTNYEEHIVDVTVLVDRSASTVTLSPREFTYAEDRTIDFKQLIDGNGNGEVTYSVSNKEGVEFEFTDGTVSNITMAGGTFTLTVSKAETEDYAACEESFVITLNKGIQTLAVTGSGDPTYGEAYTVSVDGNIGTLSYSVNEADGRFDGYILTANRAGTINYTVTAAATDLYEGTVEVCEVEFLKAPLKVTIKNVIIIYGDIAPTLFDLMMDGLIDGDSEEEILKELGVLEFDCDYSQGGGAGNYEVGLKDECVLSNYEVTLIKGTLFVKEKNVNVTIIPAQSEYGADIAELKATAVGIIDGDENVYELWTNAEKGSLPGNYYIYVRTLNDNYTVTKISSQQVPEYTITKATVDIPTVQDVEYTGQPLKADIVSNTLYNVVSNDGGTTKGVYSVVLELVDSTCYQWADSNNVNGAQVTLYYQIVSAINSWIVQPGIDGWIYDQEQNNPDYEAKYGNSRAVIEYRSSDGTDEDYSPTVPVNAGEYLMRVTVEETEDYSGLSAVVGFTIGKADPPLPGSIPFFSQPYGVSQNDLLLDGGWSWIDPSSEVLDVGTYELDASYTPSDLLNYNVLETTVGVVITPKDLTVTVSDLVIEYGQDPEFTLDYEGFIEGENESVLGLSGLSWHGYSETDGCGTFTITVDGIVSQNYEINVVSGTLTVSEATPVYQSPTSKNLTYNGKDQELVIGGTVDNGTMEYSLDGDNWSEQIPTAKEEGTYNVYFRIKGDSNYKDLEGLESIAVKILPCPHDYEHACDTDCGLCGTVREIYHNFDGEWQFDEEGHWCECLTEGCDAHNEKVEHISSGSATEDVAETCTVCGYIIAPALGHECVPVLDEMLHDEHTHWYGCTGCEERVNESVHDFDNDCDPECNTCTYEREITHSYTDLEHDSQGHWYECECGDGTEPEAHSGGTATCANRAVCSTCGQQYGELADHSYDNACDSSCNVCGSSRSVGSHQYGSDNTCDECGHVRYVAPVTPSVPSHTHHYSDACDTTCNGCSHIRTVSHTFGTEWTHGDHHHWMECKDCGHQSQLAEHVYSTDVEDTQCNVCGHDWKIHHTFEVLHMDDEGHWHECAHDECTETANFMEHTPSDPHPETGTIVCIDCGHDLTNVSSSVDDGDGGNNMAVIIAAVVGVIAVFGVGAFFLLRGKP